MHISSANEVLEYRKSIPGLEVPGLNCRTSAEMLYSSAHGNTQQDHVDLHGPRVETEAKVSLSFLMQKYNTKQMGCNTSITTEEEQTGNKEE
jgi:hypothetical protein